MVSRHVGDGFIRRRHLSHREDRAWPRPYDLLGDASHQQVRHTRTSMRPHHNQARSRCTGVIDDCRGRRSDDSVHIRVEPQAIDGRDQVLEAFACVCGERVLNLLG